MSMADRLARVGLVGRLGRRVGSFSEMRVQLQYLTPPPPHFLYDGKNRYMHRYRTRRKKLIEQNISKIGPQTKKLRQISYLSQIL